jgi:NtrC-family two-component system response regulator AlgB
VLDQLLAVAPSLAVVMFTAYANIATAVEAMRRGAFDFIPKPFTPDQIRTVLAKVAKTRSLEQRVRSLESQLADEAPAADLTSVEPAMQRSLEIAFKAGHGAHSRPERHGEKHPGARTAPTQCAARRAVRDR